jgi:hypothetical protein
MKRLFLLSIACIIAITAFSQQPDNDELKKSNAFLRFDPTEVNLGAIEVTKIDENTGNLEFFVYNDGAKPLIISQVTACCGTTVREWPRQPIAPGQKGSIKVFFRVERRPSRISRTVTVNSNAANGAVQKIAILGEVVLEKQSNEIEL